MFPPDLTPRPDRRPQHDERYLDDPAPPGRIRPWKILLVVAVIAVAGVALLI